MNARGNSRHIAPTILIVTVFLSFLLSACQPASDPIPVPPADPTANVQQPVDLPVALPTQAPAEPTQPASNSSGGGIFLDQSDLAKNLTIETVPGVPASADTFWPAKMPQHTVLSLPNYPLTGAAMQPQIFFYPVADLAAVNEAAGKAAADLQALLESRQPGDELPFLPLVNAKQTLHAQVQFLDFKSGKGVRFLTQYNQGPVKINNVQLIYTFQGLTSDGKYYVAAVLPVSHPDLPSTEQVYSDDASKASEFPAYLTATADWLNQQSASSFTPDLARLDALIQSIEIQ